MVKAKSTKVPQQERESRLCHNDDCKQSFIPARYWQKYHHDNCRKAHEAKLIKKARQLIRANEEAETQV